MSIIRLPVLKDEVFKTDRDGSLATEGGFSTDGLGRFPRGSPAPEASRLREFIVHKIAMECGDLGFLVDPEATWNRGK